MPGTRCAVAVCNNSIIKAKQIGISLRFHSFPVKNKEVCTIWMQKCNRKDKFNPSTSTICSEHFMESDYQRDLQAELLKLPPRRRLKPTAIPSLKINQDPPVFIETYPDISTVTMPGTMLKYEYDQERTADNFSGREKYAKCDIQTAITEEALESKAVMADTSLIDVSKCEYEDEPIEEKFADQGLIDHEHEEKFIIVEPTVITPDTHFITVKSEYIEDKSVEDKCASLSEQYEIMKEKIGLLQAQLDHKDAIILEQKTNIEELEKSVVKLQCDLSTEDTYRSNMEKALNKFLTKPQREILFRRRKKVKWGPEDLENAFAILCFSKKCYKYLREKRNYPLPAISSLHRWAAKLNVRKDGILSSKTGLKRNFVKSPTKVAKKKLVS